MGRKPTRTGAGTGARAGAGTWAGAEAKLVAVTSTGAVDLGWDGDWARYGLWSCDCGCGFN